MANNRVSFGVSTNDPKRASQSQRGNVFRSIHRFWLPRECTSCRYTCHVQKRATKKTMLRLTIASCLRSRTVLLRVLVSDMSAATCTRRRGMREREDVQLRVLYVPPINESLAAFINGCARRCLWVTPAVMAWIDGIPGVVGWLATVVSSTRSSITQERMTRIWQNYMLMLQDFSLT